MSALGHEQTSRYVRVMSVIPLNADIDKRGLHVRFVPIVDMAIAEWLKRGNADDVDARRCRAGLAPAPFYDGARRTLAAECRSPTIHLGLGDLACSDQRRDTCSPADPRATANSTASSKLRRANLGVEAGKSDVLVACELRGADGIFTIHRIGATYVARRGLDLKI